jgi:hypothetical protein
MRTAESCDSRNEPKTSPSRQKNENTSINRPACRLRNRRASRRPVAVGSRSYYLDRSPRSLRAVNERSDLRPECTRRLIVYDTLHRGGKAAKFDEPLLVRIDARPAHVRLPSQNWTEAATRARGPRVPVTHPNSRSPLPGLLPLRRGIDACPQKT